MRDGEKMFERVYGCLCVGGPFRKLRSSLKNKIHWAREENNKASGTVSHDTSAVSLRAAGDEVSFCCRQSSKELAEGSF